ncbi:unnamed protein product [Cuscuta campestris]|uniref:Retrovirus-related Pol polyprotein from transposon TNT 1-94-like beta-barrel domain-containing protein n=1 Tax=Cuscuta campestris TaxID=132261 RepID=A0A484L421_9ASTE|nr:unnamed protein product [Cuscuta campestris]
MEGTSRTLPYTMRFVGLLGSHSLGINPEFLATAVGLGRELLRQKIKLAYGGGSVGLQGAVASTVFTNGGLVTGFIPGYIATQRVYGPTYGVEHTVSSNSYKYFEMNHVVEAFIVLPGGVDTMEDDAMRQNFMSLSQRKLFISSFFVDELLDKLEFAKAFPGPGPKEKWDDRDCKKNNLDNIAKAAIFKTLDPITFSKIKHLKTAMEIWQGLGKLCEGSEDLRKQKIEVLLEKFKSFKMLPGESFDMLDERFHKILNDLASLNHVLSPKEKNVRKPGHWKSACPYPKVEKYGERERIEKKKKAMVAAESDESSSSSSDEEALVCMERRVEKSNHEDRWTMSEDDTLCLMAKDDADQEEAAKYPGVWYLESGCSRHITGDASLLSNLIPYDGPRVNFGGSNDFGLTKGLGNLVYKILTIQAVSYVEGLNYNPLNISQFCDKGYSLEFCKDMASLKNISTNKVILTGKRIRNIYEVIWSDVKEACLISKAAQELSKFLQMEIRLKFEEEVLEFYRNGEVKTAHSKKNPQRTFPVIKSTVGGTKVKLSQKKLGEKLRLPNSGVEVGKFPVKNLDWNIIGISGQVPSSPAKKADLNNDYKLVLELVIACLECGSGGHADDITQERAFIINSLITKTKVNWAAHFFKSISKHLGKHNQKYLCQGVYIGHILECMGAVVKGKKYEARYWLYYLSSRGENRASASATAEESSSDNVPLINFAKTAKRKHVVSPSPSVETSQNLALICLEEEEEVSDHGELQRKKKRKINSPSTSGNVNPDELKEKEPAEETSAQNRSPQQLEEEIPQVQSLPTSSPQPQIDDADNQFWQLYYDWKAWKVGNSAEQLLNWDQQLKNEKIIKKCLGIPVNHNCEQILDDYWVWKRNPEDLHLEYLANTPVSDFETDDEDPAVFKSVFSKDTEDQVVFTSEAQGVLEAAAEDFQTLPETSHVSEMVLTEVVEEKATSPPQEQNQEKVEEEEFQQLIQSQVLEILTTPCEISNPTEIEIPEKSAEIPEQSALLETMEQAVEAQRNSGEAEKETQMAELEVSQTTVAIFEEQNVAEERDSLSRDISNFALDEAEGESERILKVTDEEDVQEDAESLSMQLFQRTPSSHQVVTKDYLKVIIDNQKEAYKLFRLIGANSGNRKMEVILQQHSPSSIPQLPIAGKEGEVSYIPSHLNLTNLILEAQQRNPENSAQHLSSSGLDGTEFIGTVVDHFSNNAQSEERRENLRRIKELCGNMKGISEVAGSSKRKRN